MYLCCLSLSVFMFKATGRHPGDCGEEPFCFHACEVLADFTSEGIRALKEVLLAGGRMSSDSILPLCLVFKGQTCHSLNFYQRNRSSIPCSENVARSKEELPPLLFRETHPSGEVWRDGELKPVFLRAIVCLKMVRDYASFAVSCSPY